MKNIYLLLAIIGYAATFPLMMVYSAETNNWLFWTKPLLTFEGLTANDVSTVFALDLFPAAFTFLVWATVECRKLRMRHAWAWWVTAFLFGLAGTYPLFLYFRERAMEREAAA